MKVLIVYAVVIVAVLGLGFWLFTSSNQQQANLPGNTFESQGQTHITEGSTDHPAYNSNPPTSGWHWPAPANWGVYEATQPDERLVHNLEHGGIWISYKPGSVDDSVIAQLKDFTKRYRKVIVEPRAANETPIALAAWTHSELLQSYDESTILRFIDAYYDQGPEKVD